MTDFMKIWVTTVKPFDYFGSLIEPGVTIGCPADDPNVIAGLENGTLEPGTAPEEAIRLVDADGAAG